MSSTSKDVRKQICANIKRVREQKGLTQEEVAKEAGMSSNYFAKIERGEPGAAPEKIYAIIKALKVDASEIFPA